MPVLTADKDLLHLEARYSYEALDTASLWVGCNLATGKDLTIDFTPMLGAVFGEVNGLAPGYELTLSWNSLELYTEGEYVISTEDKSDNFFYSWSQLTIAPVEWFYAGIAAQRTHAYHSDRELDVGPIVGIVYKSLNLSAYALNLDDQHPILGVSLEWTF